MSSLAADLIDWYGKNRIPYPWRQTRDPYKVWLSEILLQQTRIPVALPFYEKIVQKYPALESIAEADPESFVAEWSGIGYYRRARNMHACAKRLSENHGGEFPEEHSNLLQLPGIGRYTAGALRNLCFDRLTPAVDGNISRVLARICMIRQPMGSKQLLEEVERAFIHLGTGSPSSDFFQGLMELGERICLPDPDCPQCPVQKYCSSYSNGAQYEIPLQREKRKIEKLFWYQLLLSREDRSYFAQNPSRGFLKEAWLLPDILSAGNLSEKELEGQFVKKYGIYASGLHSAGAISHTVTFRKLNVQILKARSFELNGNAGMWLNRVELKNYPTSSVIHKIFDREIPG